MGLADAIAAERKQPGGKCPVGRALAGLPPADVAALEAALGDVSLTAAQIGRALTAEGFKTPGAAIRKHRDNSCSCAPR